MGNELGSSVGSANRSRKREASTISRVGGDAPHAGGVKSTMTQAEVAGEDRLAGLTARAVTQSRDPSGMPSQ